MTSNLQRLLNALDADIYTDAPESQDAINHVHALAQSVRQELDDGFDTLKLSVGQLSLIMTALQTAAVLSRRNNHIEQADAFSKLAAQCVRDGD